MTTARWLKFSVVGIASASLAGSILIFTFARPLLLGTQLPIPSAPPNSQEDPRPVVVFLGTSLTANEEWPEEAVAMAWSRCGLDLRFLVMAAPGAISLWGLEAANEALKTHPMFVVLEFQANDSRITGGVGTDDSISNHVEMVETIGRSEDVAALVLLTNPTNGAASLLRPRLREIQDGVLGAVPATQVLDSRPDWAKRDLAQDLRDGVHPTSDSASSVYAPLVSSRMCDVAASES